MNYLIINSQVAMPCLYSFYYYYSLILLQGFEGPWYRYMFRFILLFSYIIPIRYSKRILLHFSLVHFNPIFFNLYLTTVDHLCWCILHNGNHKVNTTIFSEFSCWVINLEPLQLGFSYYT